MDEEYMPFTEAIVYLGMDIVEVFSWICALKIPVYRFTGDIRDFLAYEDVCKIKQAKV